MIRERETVGSGALSLNAVDLLMNDLRRLPKLTLGQEIALGLGVLRRKEAIITLEEKDFPPEEKERLLAVAQEGKIAADTLVLCNMRFVIKRAWAYHRESGVDLDDLIQVGAMALMRAVEKYDPHMAARDEITFLTYAGWWVRQKMEVWVRHFREAGHTPFELTERADLYYFTIKECGENGIEVDDSWMEEKLGWNMNQIKEVRRALYFLRPSSLQDVVHKNEYGEEITLGDVLPSSVNTEPSLGNVSFELVCEALEERLTPKEEKVVRLLLAGEKFHQIGKKMGYDGDEMPRVLCRRAARKLHNRDFYALLKDCDPKEVPREVLESPIPEMEIGIFV